MSIVDHTLVLSDGQAIVADAASTNVIDLLAPGTPPTYSAALARDIGIGAAIPFQVSVTEAFNNLTSMNVAIQVDDNAAFSSPKTVAKSGEIALASLVAGYQFDFPDRIPEGTDERYVRLFFDITGTAPTTGKVFAGVVGGRQTN